MLPDVYAAGLHHPPNVRTYIRGQSIYIYIYIYSIRSEAADVLVELEQGVIE
jgi:hypothetical protein